MHPNLKQRERLPSLEQTPFIGPGIVPHCLSQVSPKLPDNTGPRLYFWGLYDRFKGACSKTEASSMSHLSNFNDDSCRFFHHSFSFCYKMITWFLISEKILFTSLHFWWSWHSWWVPWLGIWEVPSLPPVVCACRRRQLTCTSAASARGGSLAEFLPEGTRGPRVSTNSGILCLLGLPDQFCFVISSSLLGFWDSLLHS